MSLCEGDSAVLSGRIDFGAGGLIPIWDGKGEVLGVFSPGFLLPIGNSPALATGAQTQAFSFCWEPALLLFYRMFGAFSPSCISLDIVLTAG